MSQSREALKLEFKNKDYRYAYAEDFLNAWVATQIVTLREQRGLNQEQFGQLIGTKQSGVSRLENVNHSSWKTETLKKIARALGVRVKITFETFGTLLDEDEEFGRGRLKLPSFEDDSAFREPAIIAQDSSRTFFDLLMANYPGMAANLRGAEEESIKALQAFNLTTYVKQVSDSVNAANVLIHTLTSNPSLVPHQVRAQITENANPGIIDTSAVLESPKVRSITSGKGWRIQTKVTRKHDYGARVSRRRA
jgi:transcriptional regulator with XRE-family HTH domain